MLRGGFAEESLEILNFQRCERPDGTFYGTGGTCRRGAPVGPREQLSHGGDGPRGELQKIAERRMPYAKNIKVSVIWSDIGIEVALEDGNIVQSFMSGNGEYAFYVNNTFDIDREIPPRQKVKIALTAKRSFDAFVEFAEEGSPFVVSPYKDDGHGESRARAFQKIGFVPVPGSNGEQLIGMKKNGKFVPPSAELMEDAMDSFSELIQNDRELVRLWIQAIWG